MSAERSPLLDITVLGPVWLFVVAAQSTLMMPLIVGNLASRLDLSTSAAGSLATAAMAGAGIAAFLQILVIRAVSWRRMAIGLVALLCISYASLAAEPRFWLGAVSVALVGFGFGGLLGLSNAALAEAGRQTQTRALGLALGLMGCVGSAIAWVVSRISAANIGVGVFIVLIVVGATGFLVVASLPDSAPVARNTESQKSPRVLGGPSFILALLAWGVINFASGGFWPLIERIATADGHPAQSINQAISLALLFTTVGGFAAMALDTRLGIVAPLLFTGFATAASVLVLVMQPSVLVFAVALCVFGFLWNFGPPYQLPVISAVDPSGRGMPAAILSMKIFMAVGPLAYGLMAEHLGFKAAGLLAATAAICSTALLVFLVRNRAASRFVNS